MVETPQRPGTVVSQPGLPSKTASPAPQVKFPNITDDLDKLAELFGEYDSDAEAIETNAGNRVLLALQIQFCHTYDEEAHTDQMGNEPNESTAGNVVLPAVQTHISHTYDEEAHTAQQGNEPGCSETRPQGGSRRLLKKRDTGASEITVAATEIEPCTSDDDSIASVPHIRGAWEIPDSETDEEDEPRWNPDYKPPVAPDTPVGTPHVHSSRLPPPSHIEHADPAAVPDRSSIQVSEEHVSFTRKKKRQQHNLPSRGRQVSRDFFRGG